MQIPISRQGFSSKDAALRIYRKQMIFAINQRLTGTDGLKQAAARNHPVCN